MTPRVEGSRYGFDTDADDALRDSALSVSAEASYDLAGWWIRVGAYLIDSVLLTIGLVIVVGVGFAINDALGAILAIAGIAVVLLGYWTYFEGGEEGQTLGKRAVGIRVRNEQGGPAGYGKAFARNLVARVIGLFPIVGLIDVLWPLWDERKQCLHDKAGATIVVRD
jgi:uncharacterized RDD family membrane protein YckC